ncbi:MAG: sigma-54-dependent Fis family transcriptional regulator [Rhodocyclales bacterium GT-UBC]|nr:MAG: sigma-54-dependent Fis family transcriptional regulator [Rhodocyclales bacterium GT-UBC]
MPAAKPLLLIVDDDSLISESLSFAFADEFDVISSHSRPHCLSLIRQLRFAPQAALIDLGLPPTPHRPEEGYALISELLAIAPNMKIIVLSGQNDESNARHARTLGAVDFVGKPCDPTRLNSLLKQALDFPANDANELDPDLLGESLPMQRLRIQLRQYSELGFPVLIEGESGCGKDIVANRHLHFLTERRNTPFLALNCAALSPTLIEPTLFGYARGAFTGATNAKAGYFEEASNGTLFLDEIGELPLELQPKLLRVLENGEYQRVGETQTRIATARIIAATNRDLRQEIRAGRFRSDLYHRLSVFTVNVPPLRDRGRDRLLLLNHFRSVFATQTRAPIFTLSPEAELVWMNYSFPGNVRELRNIVIRLTAHYSGQKVSREQLAQELDLDETLPISNIQTDSREHTRSAALIHLNAAPAIDLDATLASLERSYIEVALELSDGNMSQAARRLGINRTTLYNRMQGWKQQ